MCKANLIGMYVGMLFKLGTTMLLSYLIINTLCMFKLMTETAECGLNNLPSKFNFKKLKTN